jgi:TolA-binding protein
VLPPKQHINNLGYRFLEKEDYDKSYAFFNFNVQNYPESANVFDSMGDYYLSKSDTVKAAEFFIKSLEIGGIPESKEKLIKLINAK